MCRKRISFKTGGLKFRDLKLTEFLDSFKCVSNSVKIPNNS